ncbi:unnamed protein product [Dovyalis caffra]|uniref:Uncharacterized protein n=1 Tax=Dovyalis caffra TaxID=77055 RepID=A0AAV1SMF6_9ROSI|nr:unnamed protein product [Dovyalis caffra]
MAPATTGGSSSLPSLPPPCPKSPPEYPDLYGKRREMAKVQMLEREIGFLENVRAAVNAIYVTALPASAAQLESGGGAALVLVLDPIAVERSHAAGAAAIVNYLHAEIALVAAGHALVPNVRR